MNKDFEAFKSEISWFLNPNSQVELREQQEMRLRLTSKSLDLSPC